MADEDISPGDVVSVQHSLYGKREGLVVGSHYDYAGRLMLEVQLEPGNVYQAWSPTVTRIRRTVYRTPSNHRTLERHIYW